jgi:hypothetical protein
MPASPERPRDANTDATLAGGTKSAAAICQAIVDATAVRRRSAPSTAECRQLLSG